MRVHIYHIVGMLEYEIDKEDMMEALKEAMKRGARVDVKDFKKPDRDFIAVTIMEGEIE